MVRERGRRGNDVVQLIGVIPPARAQVATPRRPSAGPPWVAPAVLIFGALVVATAVLWAGEEDSQPDDLRADETVVTTTTLRPLLQPVVPTGPAAGPDGTGSAGLDLVRFASDPLPGWSIHSADVLTPVDPDSFFGLWATPGASATQGRWISITITPGNDRPDPVPEATRSLLGEFETSTPRTDPLRRRVFVPMLVGSAVIAARGVDVTELEAIATSVQSTGATLQAASMLQQDYTLITSGTAAAGLVTGEPVTEVIYTADDSFGDGPTARPPVDVILTVGMTYLFDPGAGLFPFVLTVVDAGVDGAIEGELVDQPGHRLLRRRSGEFVFTFEGPVDAATLRDFADSMRPFDDQEWERLVYGRPPGARLLSLEQVAGGTTADGRTWLAGVRLVGRDDRVLLLWAAAPLDTPEGPPFSPPLEQATAAGPVISSLVIPGATYVFAAVPRALPNQLLQVTVGDRTVTAPFIDIGDTGVLVAAYAFSEPVPFAAELISAGP